MLHLRACLPIACLPLACLIALSCGSSRAPPMTASCPSTCTNCNASNHCIDCDPSQPTACENDLVRACNPDGTLGAHIKMCDTDNQQHCNHGTCFGPCDIAATSRSYIGCDYWPTPTLNAQLDPMFDFSVVVANPPKVNDVTTPGPAHVKVVYGSTPCDPLSEPDDNTVQIASIGAGQIQPINLPWIPEVSQNRMLESSAQVPDGAYHLCSSLPVTVYQFNPLQFEKNPPNGTRCPPIGGVSPMPPCHSYTNDASTLLPTSTLGKEYLVVSRGTMALAVKDFHFPPQPDPPPTLTPGFFAVVGTEDNTTVTVDYRAYAAGGINLSNHAPGDSDTYFVNKGEVLQIISERPAWDPKRPGKGPCVSIDLDPYGTYCDLGKDYDLTGTHILADKPVAVFGGHSCSFAPYNKWACDHLEQQLFPLSTWGQKYLAAQTHPAVVREANLLRVISGSDANTISFEGSVITRSVTLDLGQWTEFVFTGGLAATGTGRMLVTQFMVGENYTGSDAGEGDPSMGLVVPFEQYRRSYDFLAPNTYTHQHVAVIALQGSMYNFDGLDSMMPFTNDIGTSGYGFQYLELTQGVGHHITSDMPFGISVSGTADHTSYLFPGGLNLNDLTPQ